MRGAALAVAIGLASCAPAPSAEAPRHHPAIVSLNPCTDAILAEVADPEQLLAISSYSADPASTSMDIAKASRFRTTSGTAEEVLSLHPDVVAADNFLPPATIAALRHLGVKLEQMPIAGTVEESEAQVALLARLARHPERGAALNARIEAALSRARPPQRDPPVSAVVWQSGGMVPGSNTLIADLLRRTGFASLSSARGFRQADMLPLEVMLAEPPQVILTAGNPRSNGDRMLGHPALAALRHTRREGLDPSLLWCGGPTIMRAAERLADVRADLHSEKPLPVRRGV